MSKWQSSTAFRVGAGSGLVTFRGSTTPASAALGRRFPQSQLALALPLAEAVARGDGGRGWDPRADNPGALTRRRWPGTRLRAARNLASSRKGRHASQAGATLQRRFAAGGEATLMLFGVIRSLRTRPRLRTSISIGCYGIRRASVAHALGAGHRLTADRLPAQRDDR